MHNSMLMYWVCSGPELDSEDRLMLVHLKRVTLRDVANRVTTRRGGISSAVVGWVSVYASYTFITSANFPLPVVFHAIHHAQAVGATAARRVIVHLARHSVGSSSATTVLAIHAVHTRAPSRPAQPPIPCSAQRRALRGRLGAAPPRRGVIRRARPLQARDVDRQRGSAAVLARTMD